MMHARRPRSPLLNPFVDRIWAVDAHAAHARERLLPNGRLQILVNLSANRLEDFSLDGAPCSNVPGAAVQGARSRAVIARTGARTFLCGVSFTPGGAHVFFRDGVGSFSDRLVDLEALWGSAAGQLRQRLLEAKDAEVRIRLLETALMTQACHPLIGDRRLEWARTALARGVRVRQVASGLGLGPRDVIAWFRQRTGLSPKLFARIARFQRIIGAGKENTSWSQLAAIHDYADQAHMIRDFRAFSGLTPEDYRTASVADPNHVPERGV